MRIAEGESEWPHSSLGARAFPWCPWCDWEGQELHNKLMSCMVTLVRHTYPELFLNMPNRPEARFLRGNGVEDDEESDSKDLETERVELDARAGVLEGAGSSVGSWCSMVGEARAGVGGPLIDDRRSLLLLLLRAWSLEVREGGDVKLVDCVSCE